MRKRSHSPEERVDHPHEGFTEQAREDKAARPQSVSDQKDAFGRFSKKRPPLAACDAKSLLLFARDQFLMQMLSHVEACGSKLIPSAESNTMQLCHQNSMGEPETTRSDIVVTRDKDGVQD